MFEPVLVHSQDILRTPRGNLFIFGTKVHLDNRGTWLEFGGQRLEGSCVS